MQPITRETIIDRRQPSLRWSAVFAGAIVGAGVWVLLQLFGGGLGFAAVEFTEPHVHHGASIWMVLAPIIGMFVGGAVAGMVSHTRQLRGGALHGLIAWGLTSAVAVLGSVWVSMRVGVGFHHGAGITRLISLAAAIAGGAFGARDLRDLKFLRKRHHTAPMGVPVVHPPTLAPTEPPIAPMP